MDSYFDTKLSTEIYMPWVYLFAIELFSNKFYRWARIFILVYYIIVTLINIYFYITVFETTFFYKYVSTFLATLSSIIINSCLLVLEKYMIQFDKDFPAVIWSIDCTTNKTREKIIQDFRIVTAAVLLNVFLGIVSGIVLIPLSKEQEYHFSLFFSRTYLTAFSYIFDAVYFFTFPISSYLMVYIANAIAYYVYIYKSQMYLAIDMASYVSTDYDDKDENTLLTSEEYQNVIQRRLRLIYRRHVTLLKHARVFLDLAPTFLPWFVLGFLIMGLSALSNIYIVDTEKGYWLYWRYFQNLVWAATSALTGALMVQSGQEIEDQTGALYSVVNLMRWTSFDKHNKKTILIGIMATQVPFKLQFTEKVSLNYELGIRVVRTIYSFAAIFAKVSQRF